jgi:hypothetical protein
VARVAVIKEETDPIAGLEPFILFLAEKDFYDFSWNGEYYSQV